MSNEVSHYDDILGYVIEQLKSNFATHRKRYIVTGSKGEIKAGLRSLINDGLNIRQLIEFMEGIPQLNVDLFIVVINEAGEFVLIICEIKDVNTLGLTELSQLIGYCLIADSRFGLLINVNGTVSRRFVEILESEPYITFIVRMMGYQTGRVVQEEDIKKHSLGVMIWNSKTKRLEYVNTGKIRTIPQLCTEIESILG